MVLITVFDPRGIDLKKYKLTYPELATIEEFTSLTARQLVMIWWYSNKTSPLVDGGMAPEDRIKQAIERSGMNTILKHQELKSYLDLVFPEHIKQAMDRMARFNPTVRDAAKKIILDTFNNMQQISKLDNFKDKDGNYDMSAYMLAVGRMNDVLPKIVQQLESGFGVTEIDSAMAEESGENLMSRYYEHNTSTRK